MHVLSVNYHSKSAPALFCQSLKETGFAVLTHHPIAADIVNQGYREWQDFFNAAHKANYTYQKPTQDGYFPFRTESAKDSKIGDLKEFYHYYPWGKKPPELEAASQLIYEDLTQLAAELLQWVENYLPIEIASKLSMPLRDMIVDSPNTLLRILHYPPLQGEVEEGAVRAAAHEDINLITLLPAATAPGLQVLDTKGKWHDVSCDPGNIVVNVGDMLQECTQNYYKSTTHRVVNPEGAQKEVSRYSMPLFLHPRNEVQLSERYTAQEYLHHRLREIGIY